MVPAIGSPPESRTRPETGSGMQEAKLQAFANLAIAERNQIPDFLHAVGPVDCSPQTGLGGAKVVLARRKSLESGTVRSRRCGWSPRSAAFHAR